MQVSSETFNSRSGQLWNQRSNRASSVRRLPAHNVFRVKEMITAKTRITVVENASNQSDFSLLLGEKILRHIKRRTEIGANRVLGKSDWCLTLQELEKNLQNYVTFVECLEAKLFHYIIFRVPSLAFVQYLQNNNGERSILRNHEIHACISVSTWKALGKTDFVPTNLL